MSQPYEIRIVQNPLTHNTWEDYYEKPFSVFVNGEEIKNIQRFSIDLDRTALIQEMSHNGNISTKPGDWLYTVEHFLPIGM